MYKLFVSFSVRNRVCWSVVSFCVSKMSFISSLQCNFEWKNFEENRVQDFFLWIQVCSHVFLYFVLWEVNLWMRRVTLHSMQILIVEYQNFRVLLELKISRLPQKLQELPQRFQHFRFLSISKSSLSSSPYFSL
jgi:hypothetical protein